MTSRLLPALASVGVVVALFLAALLALDGEWERFVDSLASAAVFACVLFVPTTIVGQRAPVWLSRSVFALALLVAVIDLWIHVVEFREAPNRSVREFLGILTSVGVALLAGWLLVFRHRESDWISSSGQLRRLCLVVG